MCAAADGSVSVSYFSCGVRGSGRDLSEQAWTTWVIDRRFPSPPLDNSRVMVIVWRLRGNIIRTALCWIVWHNVHSQQHSYMSSSYRSNRLGLSHWDPYAVHRGGCLELYYSNMVEWSGSGGIQAWFRWPTGFLQCFDTVGLVIWPVKSSLKWPTMCRVGR